MVALPSRPLPRLVTLLVLALGLAGTSQAAIIIVDDTGGGDYLTIQEAIDNAASGDSIHVLEGTYIEDLLVYKSLTILALDGPTKVFLLPSTSSPGIGTDPQYDTATHMIRVTASNVTIDAFNMNGDNPLLPNNPDARTGIITDSRVTGTSGLKVQNCVFKNIRLCGIWGLDAGSGLTITNNTLDPINVDPGVSTAIAAGNAAVSITSNTLTNCSQGIVLTAGATGTVSGNSMTISLLGIAVYDNTGVVTVSANRAVGCTVAYRTARNHANVTMSTNTTLGCTTSLQVQGGVDSGATIDVVGNIVDGLSLFGSVGVHVTSAITLGGQGAVQATVRRNAIFRCETAVLAEELVSSPVIDLVVSGSEGQENHFYGTTGDMIVLRGCDDDVEAEYNYWGTTDLSLIETYVTHKVDDPALGYVDFSHPSPGAPLLTLEGEPIIGQTVTIKLAGLYRQQYFLLFSGGTAEIPFPPYGILLLDPSFLRVLLASTIPEGNVASLPGPIPNDPNLVGITVYWQALVGFDFTVGDGALSNAMPMTFEAPGP
ncbi:MAG: right-handed parallel beta-helix repeat-containing protein [Planctomycetota bacterium]